VSCARARVVAVKIHTEFFAAALSAQSGSCNVYLRVVKNTIFVEFVFSSKTDVGIAGLWPSRHAAGRGGTEEGRRCEARMHARARVQ
jgi:hypothetical protein